MRTMLIGLLTLAAIYAGAWNLGAFWKLLGLPHNPGAPNALLGFAAAFFLVIGGAIVWLTGAMVLDETPHRSRFPLPPSPIPPTDQITTPLGGYRGPAHPKPPTAQQIPRAPRPPA